MTPRTPAQLHRDATEILRTLKNVETLYRWAYGVAFEPDRGSGEGRVTTDQTDPTSGVVGHGHKQWIRRRLDTADEFLADAHSNLLAAGAALGKAFKERDAYTPTVPDYDVQVTRDDVAGAREAQRRRESRGEGWGSG